MTTKVQPSSYPSICRKSKFKYLEYQVTLFVYTFPLQDILNPTLNICKLVNSIVDKSNLSLSFSNQNPIHEAITVNTPIAYACWYSDLIHEVLNFNNSSEQGNLEFLHLLDISKDSNLRFFVDSKSLLKLTAFFFDGLNITFPCECLSERIYYTVYCIVSR